ncbi:MAG: 2-C-methyl-D-erythritol 4-phosphate cytidylyltransferase [Planctomycetes bacterium]|nr:2-C-methyl-D-erythritol 4-phosphate cytidylyltransferase [Planctomycetota bacterium]
MAKISVIIPAAGAGKRFGGKTNKIFERIDGQPVFIRTIELFSSRDDVCQIQLVVSAQDMADMKDRFGGHLGLLNTKLVEGGQTRSQSVRNALAGLADQADLVAVHDAVRPCVSQLWLDAVFARAEQTGAAILACPIHGTIKKIADGGLIAETRPREQLWEAQTPQVFRKEIIVKAYQSGADATDDAHLVEMLGVPVAVVAGDGRNIKITTRADLAFANSVIKTLPKPKLNRAAHPFDDARW